MFTLKIRNGNAAFDYDDGRAEVARLLRTAADALERGTTGAPLHDYNGNPVGRFDLTGVVGRGIGAAR
jgi:hypothetical protein